MTKPAVTMNAEVVTIRVDHLVDDMQHADKVELIRRLAMDEYVISDIVEQLALGQTCDGCSLGTKFMQALREKLMPFMTDVAAEAVRVAVNEATAAKADAKRHSDWAWRLYHAWPSEAWAERPAMPEFEQLARMKRAEATKRVGGQPCAYCEQNECEHKQEETTEL